MPQRLLSENGDRLRSILNIAVVVLSVVGEMIRIYLRSRGPADHE